MKINQWGSVSVTPDSVIIENFDVSGGSLHQFKRTIIRKALLALLRSYLGIDHQGFGVNVKLYNNTASETP